MSNDTERAVITALTAWRQAVAELPPDFEDIPADLLPALGAVAQPAAEVTVTIPAELAGAEQEIRRLLADVYARANEAATAHYGRVISYLMRLFHGLAEDAGADADGFLRRQALLLALEDNGPAGDPRP